MIIIIIIIKRDDAVGATSRKTNMEIKKNQHFQCLCVGTDLWTRTSSGAHFLPPPDVAPPSAGIPLISGLQHQAWWCKCCWGPSGQGGTDKHTGCEMKSLLMSLSVQTVLNLFLQNTHRSLSYSAEVRSFLLCSVLSSYGLLCARVLSPSSSSSL